MKCVVATGIAPFLGISHNRLKNGRLIHYVNNLVLAQRGPYGIAEFWPERSTSLNSQKAGGPLCPNTTRLSLVLARPGRP
jgi:hypothetical protein